MLSCIIITPSCCRRPVSVPEVTCDDENVEREERKVREGGTNRDILTLRKLSKVYGQCSLRGNSKVAVNRLHLSMKPSEVYCTREREGQHLNFIEHT